MNRARVINIDTNMGTGSLARLLRTALTTAYSTFTRDIVTHKKTREKIVKNYGTEYAEKDLMYNDLGKAIEQRSELQTQILHIAGDVDAPRPDSYVMMEVSTCHITEDDNSVLAYMSECNVAANRSPLNVGNLGYGFAIMLVVDPVNDPDLDMGEAQAACEKQGSNLSDAFWNILRTAKAGGYRCVYIDRDVPAHGDLEVFNW
jgi:hypothetical protein